MNKSSKYDCWFLSFLTGCQTWEWLDALPDSAEQVLVFLLFYILVE